MRDQIEMTRGVFYSLVGICALIIFSISLEAIFKVKDTAFFDMWLSNTNLNTAMIGETSEELYQTYLTMCMSSFFVKIITPIGLAIHSYITLTKLRVNKLYVVIWTVLLIGSFGFSIIGESWYSMFFIVSSIGYIALILMMIYLGKCIYNVRGL